MNKKQITEEMKVHKEWYEEAESKEMTLEKLPDFLNRLMTEYLHDYGTVCHALAAGGIATMNAMNRHEQGGITGFQASCVMWEVIKGWMNYKGPMRLLQIDRMLYPQYEYSFKSISEDTWEYLQKEAKRNLESNETAHPNVKKHWEEIVKGKVPFGYSIGG